ncbi:uncharacterized protein LOC110243794 [Exaiptasia diaphana]|uniref:Uncharacterized protein n=1 Tax=Exaiptasia diaphana TaxID=2652724 RepID=A0A913XK61_EXADI|nr:uncharacterized protein LOC110243794 [Exaiptasia diaphana]KXJ20337.1 hypothetical protein AC249_AIPGENE28552 [Exaiptasia diaphana]
MKTFLVVLLLGLVAITFAEREKRFLWKKCKNDSECGADKCCVNLLKFCAAKRGLDQSCNLISLHGCGCKEGLSCQAKHSIAGKPVYYTCQPEPGSGDGGF